MGQALRKWAKLSPAFLAEVFIHSFIPPTLSTHYAPDNVLDAENTVTDNSIVQVVRCVPGTEESGRRMYFP